MGKNRPFVPVIHGAALDRPDEQDTILAAEEISAALERLGYRSPVVGLDLDLRPLTEIASRKPAVVFNLVEALCGDGALAHLPMFVLEHLGLRYTGVNAAGYMRALSKLQSKSVMREHGIATPRWWPKAEHAPKGRKVIVKSDTEHASIGMDQTSVVDGGRAGAVARAREAQFGSRFFAEDFLPGREFNIGLIELDDGPRVLPIPEMVYDACPPGLVRIIDYAAKWDAKSIGYNIIDRRFGLEESEPRLATDLARLARTCWTCFDLSGYARIDIRLDNAGVPHVLEVNPNPCLASDAGFAIACAAAGMSYDQMIGHILAASMSMIGSE